MELSVHHVFVALGLIVVVSFVGTVFSRSLRIPNPVILMGIGILLGKWHGNLDLHALQLIAPYFGALALILILLEAGLELSLESFLQNLARALFFGTFAYFASFFAIALTLHHFLDLSKPFAFLIASVSAGASPAILMPILKGFDMNERDKTLLDLECTVTEVLGLVVAIVIAPFFLESMATQQPTSFETIFRLGMQKFGLIAMLALTLPLAFGLAWSRFLSYAQEQKLWPMLTVGVTFLFYGVTESLGGKGAISVFFFGLVLGNAKVISRGIYYRMARSLSKNSKIARTLRIFLSDKNESVQRTSEELSFFVRTFFFVYLGFLFDFNSFTGRVLLVTVLIAVLPMMIRFLLARTATSTGLIPKQMEGPLVFLFPRGLANVVAAFAIVAEARSSGLQETLPPDWTSQLIAPVFGVILLSNLILTGFLAVQKKRELVPSQMI